MRPIVEFPTVYFITTVTKDRRRLFGDVRLARRLATMIRLACQLKGCGLLGYCILPDHFHVLIAPPRILERVRWEGNREILQRPKTKGALSRAPDASIPDLMRSIKGTFSRTMQQGHVWQRRYHLRHIMDGEELLNVVNYIQYNYQKHGLPDCHGREPYTWFVWNILGTF